MKEIPLTHGYIALVDDEDYERLNAHKWWASARAGDVVYAQRWGRINGESTTIKMHRDIMGFPAGLDVDHIDHDGLNNQRNNLRCATRTENLANKRCTRTTGSSAFKGVYWEKYKQRWRVEITKDGVRHRVGRFKDEIGAAIAYNTAAIHLYGNFAHLNEIPI
jgi:hypothetical protein